MHPINWIKFKFRIQREDSRRALIAASNIMTHAVCALSTHRQHTTTKVEWQIKWTNGECVCVRLRLLVRAHRECTIMQAPLSYARSLSLSTSMPVRVSVFIDCWTQCHPRHQAPNARPITWRVPFYLISQISSISGFNGFRDSAARLAAHAEPNGCTQSTVQCSLIRRALHTRTRHNFVDFGIQCLRVSNFKSV